MNVLLVKQVIGETTVILWNRLHNRPEIENRFSMLKHCLQGVSFVGPKKYCLHCNNSTKKICIMASRVLMYLQLSIYNVVVYICFGLKFSRALS